jgi:biotin-(acetyl-CoA carboxylase) ligase
MSPRFNPSSDVYAEGIAVATSGARFYVHGQNVIVLPSIRTTMRFAAGIICNGAAQKIMDLSGTDHVSVIALTQTGGVGSFDPATGKRRAWVSPSGNLLMTRVLQVKRGRHPEELAFYAAYAIAQIIADRLPDRRVELKWPNDVLIDGDKVCGVLIMFCVGQTYPQKGASLTSLGVGVNLAVAPDGAQLRQGGTVRSATSLAAHGWDVSRDVFLKLFDRVFDATRREYPSFDDLLKEIGFINRGSGAIALRCSEGGHLFEGRFGGFVSTCADQKGVRHIAVLDGRGKEEVYPYSFFEARIAVRPSKTFHGNQFFSTKAKLNV